MNAFPAYFPLAGRWVALAGEGEGAEARARLLTASPARLVRLGGKAEADPAAYAGAVLAFVATSDDARARAAAAAARAAGVPVNVMDRPALCDFTVPAVIDRGEVVAAVGTGGTAPLLAGQLRGRIEALLPESLGALAALLGRMQGEVRQAFPDPARRRAFLRAALARGEGMTEADLRQAVAAAQPPPGALHRIDGRGPVEGLTLREARILGQADLLVVEPGAAADVVALARRDAPRQAPGDADVDAAVAEGRLVAWITGGSEEA